MHTLTGAEMPIHSHTTNFGGSGNSDSGGGSPTAMHNKASNTNNAGGGLPHTIVQPYIGIRFYMKVSNNQVTETPTL
jgi:microcystin-dependent protein